MGSSTAEISLKLLVDEKSNKVLFAEARKDFIDFLFSLMEIPVGAIVGLLMELDHQSPIVSVYKSVKNLDPTYLQTKHQDKYPLLKPMPASSSPLLAKLLAQGPNNPFGCSSSPYFGSSSNQNYGYGLSFSSSSHQNQNQNDVFEDMFGGRGFSSSSHQNHPRDVGYEKEMVRPMSYISSITLTKDVSSLKEHNVVVDTKKAKELLKALFKSNTDTVLTDVFLGKKTTTQRFSRPDIDI